MLFVVDNSATISSSKFALLVNYITAVVTRLDIDSGKIRVGLMTFSSTPTISFRLTAYRTRVDVLNAVRQLTYNGYDTDTAAALQTLRTNLARLVVRIQSEIDSCFPRCGPEIHFFSL